jgi:hypothetical protein
MAEEADGDQVGQQGHIEPDASNPSASPSAPDTDGWNSDSV